MYYTPVHCMLSQPTAAEPATAASGLAAAWQHHKQQKYCSSTGSCTVAVVAVRLVAVVASLNPNPIQLQSSQYRQAHIFVFKSSSLVCLKFIYTFTNYMQQSVMTRDIKTTANKTTRNLMSGVTVVEVPIPGDSWNLVFLVVCVLPARKYFKFKPQFLQLREAPMGIFLVDNKGLHQLSLDYRLNVSERIISKLKLSPVSGS